ncbi:MAG: hypothetical protein GF364_08355, partial [Candidatus Lokiarchaeota archaeon]|nr:hypothetical protein [Candidatus Lokiarchaeota archaeon]
DFTRAYLLGYEYIEIQSESGKGFSSEEIDTIENSYRSFPGAEIMAEEKNMKRIEIITSFIKNDPYKLMHTLFRLTLSMLQRISNILDPEKTKLFDEISFDEEIERIKNIDERVNRKFFLIVRQLRALIQDSSLRKTQHIDTLRIMDFRLMSHLLENIGDNCVRICDHIKEFKNLLLLLIKKDYEPDSDKILDTLISVSKQATEFQRATFDAFIQHDYDAAVKLTNQHLGLTYDFKGYYALCRSRIEKSNVVILFYRYFDIYNALVDICDLIQPERL